MNSRRTLPTLLAGFLLAWLAGPPALAAPAAQAAAASGLKVLRLASESQTGFDPARAGDVRSLCIPSHLFETLLEFDPLARPVKLRPRTAAAMPEPLADSDFRSWTVRLRSGFFRGNGARTADMWHAFRAALAGFDASPTTAAAVVDSANPTFRSLRHWCMAGRVR